MKIRKIIYFSRIVANKKTNISVINVEGILLRQKIVVFVLVNRKLTIIILCLYFQHNILNKKCVQLIILRKDTNYQPKLLLIRYLSNINQLNNNRSLMSIIKPVKIVQNTISRHLLWKILTSVLIAIKSKNTNMRKNKRFTVIKQMIMAAL